MSPETYAREIEKVVKTFCREIEEAVAELSQERAQLMLALKTAVETERVRAAWMLEKAADDHESALKEYDPDQKDESAMSRAMADELRRLAARIRVL
jgi:hypothetical protein